MVSVIRKKKPLVTLYGLFGVPPGSSTQAIHDRYLELAYSLRHVVANKDGGTGADGNKFRALTEAWAVLKDARRRKEYDATLAATGVPCAACKGTGVAWTFKARNNAVCAACRGTGQSGPV